MNMQTTLGGPKAAVTDLDGAALLPRTEASWVRALNRLYSHSAPALLGWRGETGRLQWRARGAARAASQQEAYHFKLGPHTGVLGLDTLAVSRLLGERRADLLPKDLRYVLLADALHPLADALEQALRLRFEWAPAPAISGEGLDTERCAHFIVQPEGAPSTEWGGYVHFEDGGALEALLASFPLPARSASDTLDWLRIPVPFLLGSTRLSLREIGSIRPGDIVSIEDWGSSGAGLLVTVDLGPGAGRPWTGLAEGSRITIQPPKDTAMTRETPPPSAAFPEPGDDAVTNLPLDRLDALEVALRFEVGELSLSLGELKSIRPGHVFDLSQPLNRSPVRILAYGNLLGKGHLVAVGDRLGVRVAEFAPSEL